MADRSIFEKEILEAKNKIHHLCFCISHELNDEDNDKIDYYQSISNLYHRDIYKLHRTDDRAADINVKVLHSVKRLAGVIKLVFQIGQPTIVEQLCKIFGHLWNAYGATNGVSDNLDVYLPDILENYYSKTRNERDYSPNDIGF